MQTTTLKKMLSGITLMLLICFNGISQKANQETFTIPAESSFQTVNQKKYNESYSEKGLKEEGDWLYWHSGDEHTEFGLDEGGPIKWATAIRFKPEHLTSYDGKEITNFRIQGGQSIPDDAALKIYQGVDSDNLTEKRSQNILNDLATNTWSDIILNNPYEVNANEELWIVVEWDDKGEGCHPAALDTTDTNADGLGNFHRTISGNWRKISSQGVTGNWKKEIQIDSDWMYWHGEALHTLQVGTIAREWISAIGFETDDIKQHNGKALSKVRVFVNDIPSRATLKVWQGNDINNLTEYRSQVFNDLLQDDSWIEIELSQPYTVNANEELFVGVLWNDSDPNVSPAMFANNVNADGKGNLVNIWHQGWETLSDIELDGDWLIEVFFEKEIALFDIEFDIMDQNFNPINDATVNLNGIQNPPGNYLFEGYSPDFYQYEVTKQGYNSVIDYLQVINADVLEEVILIKDDTYTVDNELDFFEVYPNPANNEINIKDNELMENVNIVDIAGRSVYNKSTDKKQVTINVQDFDKGMYILIIESKSGIFNKKINIIK